MTATCLFELLKVLPNFIGTQQVPAPDNTYVNYACQCARKVSCIYAIQNYMQCCKHCIEKVRWRRILQATIPADVQHFKLLVSVFAMIRLICQ